MISGLVDKSLQRSVLRDGLRRPGVQTHSREDPLSLAELDMGLMTKTYRLERRPPNPMSWEVYERTATAEWQKILGGPATTEQDIQGFLERNPAFVPGAFSFPTSGHGPIHGGVFARPALRSTVTRVPDFMWLATASDIIYPVLVEIETPAKRWFTAAGQPTAAWTQARGQLVEWKEWLGQPSNIRGLLDAFEVPSDYRHHAIEPQFVLVFGRRAEFASRPGLRRRRALQRGPNEFHVTFDRIRPDRNASYCMTLRHGTAGIEATTVPPTIRLGPAHAHSWLHVRGREAAARAERRMSVRRREFVARRFSYWDSWAKRPDSNFCVMNDSE